MQSWQERLASLRVRGVKMASSDRPEPGRRPPGGQAERLARDNLRLSRRVQETLR